MGEEGIGAENVPAPPEAHDRSMGSASSRARSSVAGAAGGRAVGAAGGRWATSGKEADD